MSLSKIVRNDNYHLCDPTYDPTGLYTLKALDLDKYVDFLHGPRVNGFGLYVQYGLGDNPASFYFKNIKLYPNNMGFTCNLLSRATKSYLGIRVQTTGLAIINDVDDIYEWAFLYIPEQKLYNLSVVVDGLRYFIYYPPKTNTSALLSPAIPIALTYAQCEENVNTKFVCDLLKIKSHQELLDSFVIEGNFSESPWPISRINYCRDDCVDMLEKQDDTHWKCNYKNMTSGFLTKWGASGWAFPDWTPEEKDNICRGTDNPLKAPPEICGGDYPNGPKTEYCIQSVSNFFSPECSDYMKKEAEYKKKEIPTVFSDALDAICAQYKSGKPFSEKLSDDVMRKLKETCNCVLTDAEKKQALDKLKEGFEDDGQYINLLVSRPVNCWLDKCQETAKVPILRDYSGCGDVVVCVESVTINSDGTVSNVDVSQSEACKKIIRKKGSGSGGSGESRLWLWILLGAIGIIAFVAVVVWRVRAGR